MRTNTRFPYKLSMKGGPQKYDQSPPIVLKATLPMAAAYSPSTSPTRTASRPRTRRPTGWTRSIGASSITLRRATQCAATPQCASSAWGGALRLTGQVRGAFPPGPDAPWPRPSLEAFRSGSGGASFERYGDGGFPEAIRRRVSQGAAAILRDASGDRLHLRSARPGDDIPRAPRRFCYVLGGPRGFVPFSSKNVDGFIEGEGVPKLCVVSLRGGVQFSSSSISFLQVFKESGQLRPSLSSLYGGARVGVAKFEFPPISPRDIWITKYRFRHKLRPLGDTQRRPNPTRYLLTEKVIFGMANF